MTKELQQFEPSLPEVQDRLQYRFRSIGLLIEALTHASYRAETNSVFNDNQRLEFLGDAVIQIIVTDKIYQKYPSHPEGKLTKIRAAITRQPRLAQLAKELELGKFLRLGHGERMNKGHERDSILCDAFESLIGAVFLDSGSRLDAAAVILNRLVDKAHPEIENLLLDENPKGAFQEWSQKRFQEKPVYEVLNVNGPDHEKIYTIGVTIGETRYGTGTAGKRQTAEQNAARVAMESIISDGLADGT